MKTKTLSVLIALFLSLLIFPQHSYALLNNFDTAAMLDEGKVKGKLGVTGADDIFAFFAGGNYGIRRGLEITGRLGLLDIDVEDNETGALLGVGGRYRAALFADPKYPDVVLQGTYDLGFADGKALHSLAGGFLFSRVFSSAKTTTVITPYGGVELEFMGGSLNDDTDLFLHIPLGVEFFFDRVFGLTLEGKIGGNSSLGIAVSYRF